MGVSVRREDPSVELGGSRGGTWAGGVTWAGGHMGREFHVGGGHVGGVSHGWGFHVGGGHVGWAGSHQQEGGAGQRRGKGCCWEGEGLRPKDWPQEAREQGLGGKSLHRGHPRALPSCACVGTGSRGLPGTLFPGTCCQVQWRPRCGHHAGQQPTPHT